MGSGGAYVSRAHVGGVRSCTIPGWPPQCPPAAAASTPAPRQPRNPLPGATFTGPASGEIPERQLLRRAHAMGVYGRARFPDGLERAHLRRQRPRRGGPRPATSTSRVRTIVLRLLYSGTWGCTVVHGSRMAFYSACLPRQRPRRGGIPDRQFLRLACTRWGCTVAYGSGMPRRRPATRSQANPCRTTRVAVGDAVKLASEKVGKTGLRRVTRRGSWKVAAGDRVLPCHDDWWSRGRARPATSTMASSFSTTSGSTAARSTTDTSRW